ncbi:LysR family transcriptional regulator [Methylobacterium brachythecii]|uniref:DNA-binding transcriptional LysR family regulator n=1 Tax=Methylobacterium brachythecii TaxID=1176177 RepID=A0A7W6F7R8_9HYPH|nr:LysR family transcriptional regulator [Methylobacterium brachythecii]MBB3903678.1 DNA-binding transcriptional LysR family regulator [Methylobacterium brachythecii]GLS44248.1 LysR family transcriptional regulator [Methylobacterium brachythecii]
MLDWDDLRFFLALARHGTLSAAAKVLHVSQSTVGRRLTSLEATLAVRLLNRTPDGYVPTLAGVAVREKAEQLEAAALALERDVSGRDARLRGLVRVTCAETMAAQILAPSFARLHASYPDVMVELIPNPRELSLSMREADISVRLKQPEQHDLVLRRIGGIAFGLYATADYLADHGAMDFGDGCSGHRLITQLDDTQEMTQSAWLTELASRATVVLQTSSHEAAVLAAANGGGLACLARFRADAEPRLTRISVRVAPPSADVLLLVHKDNRDTPRIRVVLTHITECIRALGPMLQPEDASEQDARAMAVRS